MTSVSFPMSESPLQSGDLTNYQYIIRVVIIENKSILQNTLSDILSEFCPFLKLIGTAHSIAEGRMLLESMKPDLVFLDVEMDDGSAFELLSLSSYMSYKIVFTSPFEKYALKAFKYGAIDYLLKPYNYRDVLLTVERVKRMFYDRAVFNKLDLLIKKNRPKPNNKISISTANGISLLLLNEIIRLEADRSYCSVILCSGERHLVSKPLKEFQKILPADLFYRVHITHLVNIKYVRKYVKEDGGYAIMSNNDRVPVARRRKFEFIDFLTT